MLASTSLDQCLHICGLLTYAIRIETQVTLQGGDELTVIATFCFSYVYTPSEEPSAAVAPVADGAGAAEAAVDSPAGAPSLQAEMPVRTREECQPLCSTWTGEQLVDGMQLQLANRLATC